MIPGAGSRARATLVDAARAFEACGWRAVDADDHREGITLTDGGELDFVLRQARQGRVVGGTWALEISTAHPVLPPSGGLRARGIGALRMRGVRFRAGRNDVDGRRLAAGLSEDRRLSEALSAVHFESVRVQADGTPVIRHLGGSVVWVLVPPVIRATPLEEDQASSIAGALRAFAAAGGS
jgi:hypothetical protein